MAQAGARTIVVYPISPTALNQVVRNACGKGVTVVAYDAGITEPCAYNVTIDQEEAGRVTPEWLARSWTTRATSSPSPAFPALRSITLRIKEAKEVFAENPGTGIIFGLVVPGAVLALGKRSN